MTRLHRIGFGSIASVALLISLVAARHARSERGASIVPPACALLTTTEATALGGFSAKVDSSGDMSTGNSCVFKRIGGSDIDPDVVEITTRAEASASSAHTDYPKWVHPLAKPNPIMVWSPLPGVGDEATLEHTTLPNMGAGIYFRSGAVLVKVGVYPLPSDSALATAARLMVSRM